jgi:hypothetical protein
MKLRNTLIVAGSALAISAALAGGACAGTLTASAVSSVTVVSPTMLTKTQDMAFGTVIRPSSASANTTFKLDTADHVTATGGDGSVVGTTTTSSAKFSIVTTPGIAFTPSAVLTFAPAGLINIAAGNPLVTGATGAGPTYNLAANGTATLAYGGQFDVTPTTAAQTYTGTLALTVTYN